MRTLGDEYQHVENWSHGGRLYQVLLYSSQGEVQCIVLNHVVLARVAVDVVVLARVAVGEMQKLHIIFEIF